MESFKKYISPGAWFSMEYPAVWSEFEDSDPDEWTGNFRISAYRGNNAGYGRESVRQELKENVSAALIRVGALDKGESVAEAERVIASLQVRKPGVKYPAELIPVRLSEIYQIDEAYEWVEKTVKDLLKKDFQGVEEDVESMQQVVDRGVIGLKKKDQWLALGIALCVIMANEADGLEWRTLIDGNREAPVLLNTTTGQWTDPMKLAWSKVKAGEKVNLAEAYCNA